MDDTTGEKLMNYKPLVYLETNAITGRVGHDIVLKTEEISSICCSEEFHTIPKKFLGIFTTGVEFQTDHELEITLKSGAEQYLLYDNEDRRNKDYTRIVTEWEKYIATTQTPPIKVEEPKMYTFPKEVFLGGTCNGSTWREELMPMLDDAGVKYFNPVVDDWDVDAQILEDEKKEECDWHIYVITPKATGVYAIAELVERAIKFPHKTIVGFKHQDDGACYTLGQIKSMDAISRLIGKYGVAQVNSLYDIPTIFKQIKELDGMTPPILGNHINRYA